MPDSTHSRRPTTLQPIAAIIPARDKHWVGDGFHVHSIFSPHGFDPQTLSPFVLLDYAEPRHFPPSSQPRGVGEHPHRGFETVTFALQGEVAHRDSHGGGGTIRSGDVQWMTAGSGVVHEEFQSPAFTAAGGTMEMVQLWVNLPARLKMTTPRYQALSSAQFPRVDVGAATARLFAGSLHGQRGPARTHTPITAFELDLPADGTASVELPAGHTTLALVLEGQPKLQTTHRANEKDLIVFDRDQPGAIEVSGSSRVRLLVLSGEPLGEPVVAHGPFVMNTREEIEQAFADFRAGKMGTLRPRA
ncbi:MAG: pirin family protein [Myxococcales bacterium FL481]|nr:MAG: pirin family protein [Myxococcales bacterium FL481]